MPVGTHFRANLPRSYVRDNCLGYHIAGSDWGRTRIAFLVGLLGSPDQEIRRKESEHSTITKDTDSQFLYVSFASLRTGPVGLYFVRFLSVGNRPASLSPCRHNRFNFFHMFGRASRSPGLRFPPVALSLSPPDQSFFYALDSPATSTQSSLGNLLPDSALVRLVSRNSRNQLAELPGYPSKGAGGIPAPFRDSSIPTSSFNQPSPEIRSPLKAKRRTLGRRSPPTLPIQSPPDSPISVEPEESSPSGNFMLRLHTPEPPTGNRRRSRPYVQSRADPSTSANSGFLQSPSQEFHTCDEQSPGVGLGPPSPASPFAPPVHHLLANIATDVKSLSTSLFVNAGGGSPFFAPTPENQSLCVPRQGTTNCTEDSLGRRSPTVFVSSSTSAMAGVKLVPFSASARASVVSESPSYSSEYAYQGGASPTMPYELEEYYQCVGTDAIPPGFVKSESPGYLDGHWPASGSSLDGVSYVVGSNPESSITEVGRTPDFCAPGVLFSIPEEDTQAESSGSRSRSDQSLSCNGSARASASGSLPLISSSCAVSFVSTPAPPRHVNHSTPGASGTGRSTSTGTGSLPMTSMVAWTALQGAGTSNTSPHNVNTLRIGARENCPGSGDLNDGPEISGVCMNGLYEELEEWGCEWVLQNQPQKSGPSAERT